MKYVFVLIVGSLFLSNNVLAQKTERNYIRKGNRFFKDSTFVDAEVNYRKALEVNPQSTISMYNLGTTLSQNQKYKEAMEQYVAASKIEKNKNKLAHIYHNMGVLFQAGKNYAQAVEAYKLSLKNNPKDDETRYNLALAQKMLKDQQQDQNKDQNKDQKKDQKKENKEDQNQDKNKDKQKEKEKPKPEQSQKKEDKMSKENAEQLLNSVMQDEKNIQDKVKKQQKVIQSGRLEKDW
ncbi:MAG: tetratricopeptide repeat protein [Bacteroides sp.]